MARKRMIDPGIWTDDGFLRLSIPARMLWIGLISHADDDGRGSADCQTLKAKVFPVDDMPNVTVAGLRDELQTNMRVTFYELEGREFYQLDRWKSHQFVKDKKNSTVPEAPSDRDRTGTGPEADRSRSDVGPEADRDRSPMNEGKKEKKERKETGPTPDRKPRAPGVLLSDEEYADLVAKHGKGLVTEACEYLSAYKESSGKRYKSDAGALRQFGIQAALERREKARKSGAAPPSKLKGWKCPRCGEQNTHTGAMCLKCGADRAEKAKEDDEW